MGGEARLTSLPALAARAGGAALLTLALWRAGSVLPAPSVLHPASLEGWWERLGPATAFFALLRALLLVAAGAFWVALAAVALCGLAYRVALVCDRMTGRERAARPPRGDWAATVGGRLVLRVALGVSTAGGVLGGCAEGHGSVVAPAAGASATGAPAPGAVGDGTAGSSPVTAPPAPVLVGPPAPPGRSTAQGRPPLAGPPAPPGSQAPHPVRAPDAWPHLPALRAPAGTAGLHRRPAPRHPGPDRVAVGSRTWTIRPGDSFWSIAEEVTQGSAAGAYWSRLVQANRDRLVEPDDPDLLFPGQSVVLPPP